MVPCVPKANPGLQIPSATLNVFSLPVAVMKEKAMEEHQLQDGHRREEGAQSEPLPFCAAQQGEVAPQGATGKRFFFMLLIQRRLRLPNTGGTIASHTVDVYPLEKLNDSSE